MSTSLITDANWSGASLIGGAPAPLTSGTRQRMVVRGLSRDTTYFFAVKSVDDANNVSSLSNVVRWDWVFDTAPPSAPTGVSAGRESDTEARIRWSPSPEPDVAGYTVYRRDSESGSYQALNGPPVAGTEFLDNGIPAGVTQVWYQVTATDASGNESARSATIILSLVASGGEFAVHAVYPNPSRSSQTVNIPIEIPLAGAGNVELHIYDKISHLVRVLPLSGLSSGPTVVVWDGRNHAGRLVAPGVYTIRFKGTTDRHDRKKAVRVP